jgi:hypothetical protein
VAKVELTRSPLEQPSVRLPVNIAVLREA